MPMYQRPPFWRVPHQRPDPDDVPRREFGPKNKNKVTPSTPAGKELVRGDIIAKIDDYDARDLRHEDAQNLFKNASNHIKLVVQRGGSSSHLYSVPRASGSFVGRVPTPTFYHEYADVDREGPRTGTPMAPRSPLLNVAAAPYRTPSPLPAPGGWRGPESLPRSTPLPQSPYIPQSPYMPQVEGDYRTLMLSPSSTIRTDDTVDESIQSQPYRTTPLVLPGAKVRREPGPTESYLRHHPNPAIRAPPHHDYRDTLMKQKVAESVLQRVVGEEGSKMVHKQFNSPINMYSDQNIANSIRQQSSPLPSNGYYGRPHVVKSPRWCTTRRARRRSARCRRTACPRSCRRCPCPSRPRSSPRRPTRGQCPLRNQRSSLTRHRKENKRPLKNISSSRTHSSGSCTTCSATPTSNSGRRIRHWIRTT